MTGRHGNLYNLSCLPVNYVVVTNHFVLLFGTKYISIEPNRTWLGIVSDDLCSSSSNCYRDKLVVSCFFFLAYLYLWVKIWITGSKKLALWFLCSPKEFYLLIIEKIGKVCELVKKNWIWKINGYMKILTHKTLQNYNETITWNFLLQYGYIYNNIIPKILGSLSFIFVPFHSYNDQHTILWYK